MSNEHAFDDWRLPKTQREVFETSAEMAERQVTDRELLELSAKAAGINTSEWEWDYLNAAFLIPGEYDCCVRRYWSPLTDHGDAFDLVVVLGIPLAFDHSCGAVTATDPWTGKEFVGAGTAQGKGDPEAVCRVIVLAAAEIGRSGSK